MSHAYRWEIWGQWWGRVNPDTLDIVADREMRLGKVLVHEDRDAELAAFKLEMDDTVRLRWYLWLERFPIVHPYVERKKQIQAAKPHRARRDRSQPKSH